MDAFARQWSAIEFLPRVIRAGVGPSHHQHVLTGLAEAAEKPDRYMLKCLRLRRRPAHVLRAPEGPPRTHWWWYLHNELTLQYAPCIVEDCMV